MFKDLGFFLIRYVMLALAVKLADRGIINPSQTEAFATAAIPYVIAALVFVWGARTVIKARILALTMGAMDRPTITEAKAAIKAKRAPAATLHDRQVPTLRRGANLARSR